jgi:glycosyltransferase involved in cell wall biosynthesis
LNYHQECGNCPVLAHSHPGDLSHKTWLRKQKAYKKLAFDFIAPSSWMGDRAKEASLARGKRVHVISNALETEIFKPMDRAACRAELNIDQDAIVVLAGYMPSKFDRHKGLPELIDTLKILPNQSGVDPSKLLFLFYGSDGTGVELDIPVAHRFLGKISSDETLVKLYSLSDVFVLSSLEESMGYTALESIACGTPVAAFNTSGVTDIVKHQLTGYLAELQDPASLARGICWILNEGKSADLSESARQWASDNFNLRVIAKQHSALYKEILSR